MFLIDHLAPWLNPKSIAAVSLAAASVAAAATALEASRKLKAAEARAALLESSLQRLQASTSGAGWIRPIGTVASCFMDCQGTPRQPVLAPASRAEIRFLDKVSPAALEGLEDFSHVWVVFLFHLNTDVAKVARVHREKGRTFPSKATPPRAGRKVGVFACRTPHRPNPIGLSVARVEKVLHGKRTIVLSAVDLVDGTPVLDVKPYLPGYDCDWPGDATLRAPAWQRVTSPTREVVFAEAAAEDLRRRVLVSWLRIYRSAEEAKEALRQVLRVDVSRRGRPGKPYCMHFDGLKVTYSVASADEAHRTTVLSVEKCPPLDRRSKLLGL